MDVIKEMLLIVIFTFLITFGTVMEIKLNYNTIKTRQENIQNTMSNDKIIENKGKEDLISKDVIKNVIWFCNFIIIVLLAYLFCNCLYKAIKLFRWYMRRQQENSILPVSIQLHQQFRTENDHENPANGENHTINQQDINPHAFN